MITDRPIWLIEYVGAVPSPVYVPADYRQTHGNYTLDAWAARWFNRKIDAEAWMANPVVQGDGQLIRCAPYLEPWRAVQHRFSD